MTSYSYSFFAVLLNKEHERERVDVHCDEGRDSDECEARRSTVGYKSAVNSKETMHSVSHANVLMLNYDPVSVRGLTHLQGLMVVGFDVYHGRGGSVGAMVCTTSMTSTDTPAFGSYYSTVSFFNRNRKFQEVSSSMAIDIASESAVLSTLGLT
jgi:hypothetical protein